jgi:hypothetical protein
MKRHTRFRAVAVLLLTLTQCHPLRGSLPPFETAPPPLLKGQMEPVTRVAVCYNALTTDADRVREIAAVNCDPGTTPAVIDRDVNLRNCPVLMATRVTFACVKP